MNRIVLFPIALGLAATIAACTDATAPDASQALLHHGNQGNDAMVPLKGTVFGRPAATNPGPAGGCPAGFDPTSLVGEGRGTLLGKLTVFQTHCSNPTPVLADPPTFVFEFVAGEMTLTAANGAEVFNTYSGHTTVTLNPNGPPQILVNGEATVTGGSGRFSGATGTWNFMSEVNAVTGEFAGLFKGTISKPGH